MILFNAKVDFFLFIELVFPFSKNICVDEGKGRDYIELM